MVQILNCPTRDELVRLNDDEIPGDLAESLFDHIEDCQRCEAIYGELEEPPDDLLQHLAWMTTEDLERARQAIEADTLKETATSLWGKLSPSRPSEDRQPSLAIPCRLGQYEVLRLIDCGGMGEVYEARHVRLKRPVAVKVILGYRQDDPVSHQHFLQEMETAGQLEHPNLVRSYDAWEHDGCLFLAQELLIGHSLQTLVNRREFGGAAQIVEALLGTCQALEQLHDQGFVHRDVKPANVMRLEDGTIKLIDYGLAIAADSGKSAVRAGAGTPGYMSPEQAHGGYLVDRRSDIYSTGRLLLYLMNKCEGLGELVMEAEPTARLRELAARMTQFAPSDRPHSVSSVIDELKQLQTSLQSAVLTRSSSEATAAESGPKAALKPVEQNVAAEDPLPASSWSGSGVAPHVRRMNPTWLAWCVVSLLAFGWAAYQLVFKTDRQTTVLVENHQPGDVIRITSDAGQVRSVELGDPAKFVVEAGSYQLSLAGPNGRRLNPAHITVTGRDHLTVRVEDVPAAGTDRVETPPTPGQPFPLRTVLLPAGRFVMGAVDGDSNAQPSESPRRKIEFSEPFRMSMYEITVGQFREFVESMGYRTEAEVSVQGGWKVDRESGFGEQAADLNWANPGYPVSDHYPVTMVTYADALAFCDWLGKRDDRLYRLPTEAEWEYACRAGTSSVYPFDENARDASAWSRHNVGEVLAPRPVGTRKPNAWGLHDMSGNAREWCIDWYAEDAYQKSYVKHLAGPTMGDSRVVRGGCFNDRDALLRSSYRGYLKPKRAVNNQGFRVVEGWIPVAEPPSDPTERPQRPQPTTPPARLSAPFSASEIEVARQQWSDYLRLPPTQIIGLASDPSYRLELILIPPGTFQMGMPAGLDMMAGNKPEWAASSRPAHQVTITQPFYLSRYEVTQKQFREVVGQKLTPVEGDGTQFPATQIMWTVCLGYCERLTTLGSGLPVGGKLRLPTEAEWEYACRAGTTTRFWIGDQIGPAQASLRISGRQMRLEPIDAFQPNPFGLFNMHGNVAEWCSDWFSPDFYGASPVDDPTGPASGTRRVIRGGGLSNPPFSATSYWRQSYEPNTRSRNIGLRPVLELPRRER